MYITGMSQTLPTRLNQKLSGYDSIVVYPIDTARIAAQIRAARVLVNRRYVNGQRKNTSLSTLSAASDRPEMTRPNQLALCALPQNAGD